MLQFHFFQTTHFTIQIQVLNDIYYEATWLKKHGQYNYFHMES